MRSPLDATPGGQSPAREPQEPPAPRGRCVVVGAGVAGLVAARALHDAGVDVSVLDKGRAVGGRLSTRVYASGRFDHGAQFFTARDPRFARHVHAWRDAGAARAWFDDAWCGAEGMSSVAEHLARDLSVHTLRAVRAVQRDGAGWGVRDEHAWHEADAVVLTPPVPQSLALLDAGGVALDGDARRALEAIAYDRCLAGMLSARWPASLPAHGVAPSEDPFAWVASNRAKGITSGDAVTVHASPAWSEAHWSTPDADVLAAMAEGLRARLGVTARPVSLKRWRYARPVATRDAPLVTAGGTLVFAGDAFDRDGGRVEGAALSGLAAAAQVLAALARLHASTTSEKKTEKTRR